MQQTDLILGPFEARNGIKLIGLSDKKLYMISLDFISLIKYSVSVQLPIFTQHIEKLKRNSINDLISRYKTIEINYSDLLDLKVKKSNWKNYINIEYDNKTIKWNILERHETERYTEIFEKLKNITFANSRS